MSAYRLVLTTCGSRDEADRLAGALVERRLAACVNVLRDVTSIYRWQGGVERSSEVMVIIKTAETNLAAIETTIKALSGYELPELVSIEIGGSADYLNWIAASIREEAR